VRAAMVIRLNQMLTGHAGVQQSVVQGLEDFLNRAITPVVPSKGTVGEADIDILAHIGLALMGEGDVEYQGATIPAAAALSQAGLTPIVPFAKDALSIFSSNAFSAGIAVLAAHDANHLLGRARHVFGLSLEGLNGNIAPFLAPVQKIRAFPGQARVAARIRHDLAGSYVRSLSRTRPLQDPLSYRTFSQVLGSAQDVLSRLRRQLGVQMNTSDDNPAVVLDIVPPPHATPQQRTYYVNGHGIHGAVLPTANFDPLSWVLQLESLSVALGHMSSTSVQRILRLGTPEFTHLSRFLTANSASIGFRRDPEDPGGPQCAQPAARQPGVARRDPGSRGHRRHCHECGSSGDQRTADRGQSSRHPRRRADARRSGREPASAEDPAPRAGTGDTSVPERVSTGRLVPRQGSLPQPRRPEFRCFPARIRRLSRFHDPGGCARQHRLAPSPKPGSAPCAREVDMSR
jgi:hypothetical protein